MAATLKSIDYNVAMTFILNNNNNNCRESNCRESSSICLALMLMWNSVHSYVVSANILNCFDSRLECQINIYITNILFIIFVRKFQGTGSRSEVTVSNS